MPSSGSRGQAALQGRSASSHLHDLRVLRPVDTVMFVFYLILLALAAVGDVAVPVWFVALGLSVVCAVLWFLARLQLGVAFSVRPEARELVTTGIYATLRHPIYLFGTLAFLLVLLALQGWAALVFWVVLIPIQLLRARREDALLAQAFGAEYDAYRRATWF